MSSEEKALALRKKKAEQIGLASRHVNGQHADESAIDVADIWNTIKRGKWIILVTSLVITVIAAGYTMTLPPVFQAQSIVSVESKPQNTARIINLGTDSRELANEIGMMQYSDELAMRVVDRLRAVADTSNVPFPILAGVEDSGEPVTDEEMVDRLNDQVGFRAREDQSLIEISATSEVPQEATYIANIFAEEYIQFSREMSRQGVVATRQFLEDQSEKRRQAIADLENEWQQYAQSNEVVTEGQDGSRLVSEYANLAARRNELEFELEQEQEALRILQTRLQTLEPDLRADVTEEQEAQGLRSQIEAIDERIAELSIQAQSYYANNPSLKEMSADELPRSYQGRGNLAEIKRDIEGFKERRQELTDQLVNQASESEANLTEGSAIARLGGLRQQIEDQQTAISAIQARIEAVDQRLAGYQGRLGDIPRQTIEREQLERRLDLAEQIYTQVQQELQRVVMTEESELGYANLVRTAFVPSVPVSPDMTQNVLLGLLLGLVLGTGLAFVRQAVNWRIYNPSDIQESGYSLVGVIPQMDREIKENFKGQNTVEVEGKELSTSLMPLLNPWSPVTENYRLVRTNLQFANHDEPLETLLITSPEPGDGKTTTAVNLAITIALSGRKVLLIDADLRRPSAHRLLGMNRGPGLADMLVGDHDMEVIQRTFIDDLFFVPAGKTDYPPTEMLDSERMKKLIELGRDKCDVVIIDSPPVLAATDPVVLATQCDATIVVTTAERTDLRALNSTKETLEAVGVSIAGVIFNRFDSEKNGGNYNYGYGYKEDYRYTPA